MSVAVGRPGLYDTVGVSRDTTGAPGRISLPVRRIIAIQLTLVALSAPAYPITGISIAWRTALGNAALLALLIGVWWWYAAKPVERDRAHVADALLATVLIVLMTNIAGPAQYPAMALQLPLVDPWLAAADAAMGIHVPTLVAWTAAHHWLTAVLIAAYQSLLLQFVLPPLVLGLRYRDRRALWEYVFNFHFCLIVTVLGVAVLPAACAFSHYGFTSLLDQTRFISHFESLRAGTFTEVRFDNIEGLITFPSFHVAGGMMVTWAFRGYRWWFRALAVLNVLLISSTVLTGAHYGIDVAATALLFALSVLLWRRWGQTG